jgi:hypothetical protein
MLIHVDSTTQEVTAELPQAATSGGKRWPAVAAGVVLACSLSSLLWHTTTGALADNDDITLTDASARSCPGPMSLQQRAELNAEQEALAAHLTSQNVPHLVSDLDTDGVRWVEWNKEHPAANAAVDAFYAAHHPLSVAEIAYRNEDADALAAHLTEHGVANSVTTSADGARRVVWDSDDDAAVAAVEEYYDAGRTGIGC